ncbi:MAG TPA: outer membrane protein assembly factor BamD [Terracidiphilus sp.]|nr:outer membrane protein assembly factor BamD [Terracidiphilus sp.]
MNRFSRHFAVAALAALVFTGIQAHAWGKRQKKDKDLSANPLANVHSDQPDKILFDKAMVDMKKGRYDIARLTLQTLLNTYPDSEYVMRAKLAVGDTWFKEGGSAALAQAEAEYKDFITFFPDAPEAAEAQMKVGDIYYEQMEKPDRDYTNALAAEREYRNMINQFPDSPLLPRAKQKLRNVQEVLAERETQIGLYYQGVENFPAAIARLETVADTYPLYSRSDQVLLAIGDCYEGEAHAVQIAPRLSGAVRERLRALYLDKAAKAYDRVIRRYPMAPHVEDARDRLVALNKPIPEPTQTAIAESDAEQRSEQPIRFTDRILGLIQRGPITVEAVHVGEPSLADPTRTIAPDINKQNLALFKDALGQGKPAEAVAAKPTAANEPPRSDQPSEAPVQMAAPSGSGTGMGVAIVAAPSGTPATDPNAVVPAVGPKNTTLPAAQPAAQAPAQINDIKPGTNTGPATTAQAGKKQKAPKADLGNESSSKKKKKKGLKKLNPF